MNALIKYDAYPNLWYWLLTYVDNISYSDFFSIYIRLTIKNPINLLSFIRVNNDYSFFNLRVNLIFRPENFPKVMKIINIF